MWNKNEIQLFKKLNKPHLIQAYLDNLTYNTDPITRSAREVIKVKKAHCFDGALFAAAVFEFHGIEPVILDLRANENDDDHVIALYKHRSCWGSIGKSNYSGLRFREPVYKNLRELAMSYFENYFNIKGEKTLREYSRPFKLTPVTKFDWRFGSEALEPLGEVLDNTRHYPLVDKSVDKFLSKVDKRSMQAGLVGRKYA